MVGSSDKPSSGRCNTPIHSIPSSVAYPWRGIHKYYFCIIRGAFVGSIDGIIISSFIGVIALGKISNYNYIAGVISGIISLFFTSLTSVVGHLCASRNADEIKEYYETFYCLNYSLGLFFFLGFYSIIDSIVVLLFDSGLVLSRQISFVITLNHFILFMRGATHLFRNASGTFYFDRWKPIVECITNLILSLLFVIYLPDDLKVVGVFFATIITNLFICDTVEPFVIFKHVFIQSPIQFYFKNYVYIGLFIIALIGLSFCRVEINNSITGIIVNFLISLCVAFAVLIIVAIFDSSFRKAMVTMERKIREAIKGMLIK